MHSSIGSLLILTIANMYMRPSGHIPHNLTLAMVRLADHSVHHNHSMLGYNRLPTSLQFSPTKVIKHTINKHTPLLTNRSILVAHMLLWLRPQGNRSITFHKVTLMSNYKGKGCRGHPD